MYRHRHNQPHIRSHNVDVYQDLSVSHQLLMVLNFPNGKMYFIDHKKKKNRFNWSLRRNHLRKSIFLIAGNFHKKIIDNYIRVKVWVAIFSIILNRTDWSNVVKELRAISHLLDVIGIIRRFYYFVFLSLPPEHWGSSGLKGDIRQVFACSHLTPGYLVAEENHISSQNWQLQYNETICWKSVESVP